MVLTLAWGVLAAALLSGLWLGFWLYMLVLSAQIPAWVLLERLNQRWERLEVENKAMERLRRDHPPRSHSLLTLHRKLMEDGLSSTSRSTSARGRPPGTRTGTAAGWPAGRSSTRER